MEIGYQNTQDYLLQLRDQEGEVEHRLIEAGSMKHAERKMRQEARDHAEAIVVTSITNNGFGQAGHGQLPNENHNIEEVVENLKGEEDQ